MKTTIYLMLLTFSIRVHAQSIKLEILDSLTKTPIENVYIYDKTNIFHSVSDKNGICHLSTSDSTTVLKQDFKISHLGYITKKIDILSLISNNNSVKILLSPKIFELEEVIISPPNANNIVKKAIENINKNYYSLVGDTINLNLHFTFLDNPNSKIADFNGKIAITDNGKEYFSTKYSVKNNFINDSFYDYRAEISPSSFYSILFIKSHAVIRQVKKMKFYYEGRMKYQKEDVYKISFERDSKCSGQKGYLLINSDNYTITYITYTIGECKKWIASTQKGKGLVFTNLNHYKVSASYVKDNEKYRFSGGTINMLFNKSKRKKILHNNTYNVVIKSTKETPELNGKKFIKINDLFSNKKTTQR